MAGLPNAGTVMIPRASRVLALSLAALLSGSSCVLVAGAGAGYVISREITADKLYSIDVKVDVDEVWPATRESLEILHDLNTELRFTEQPRVGFAIVDGAEVTVEVLAIDLDHARVRIRARKPLVDAGRTAELVERTILAQL